MKKTTKKQPLFKKQSQSSTEKEHPPWEPTSEMPALQVHLGWHIEMSGLDAATYSEQVWDLLNLSVQMSFHQKLECGQWFRNWEDQTTLNAITNYLPGPGLRNTLELMFKSCWCWWNACKHVFQWSTEVIFFWASGILKWDEFVNRPAGFFCCNHCRLITIQLLLEMGPQTHRMVRGTQIQNNLDRCTINENHSICYHLGPLIKFNLIIASK